MGLGQYEQAFLERANHILDCLEQHLAVAQKEITGSSSAKAKAKDSELSELKGQIKQCPPGNRGNAQGQRQRHAHQATGRACFCTSIHYVFR